mgnify:CR=1 FL=1
MTLCLHRRAHGQTPTQYTTLYPKLIMGYMTGCCVFCGELNGSKSVTNSRLFAVPSALSLPQAGLGVLKCLDHSDENTPCLAMFILHDRNLVAPAF